MSLHVEDAGVTTTPRFALAISHCPWIPERAEHMAREMRPVLYQARQDFVDRYEETDRAPNHVWSRRMWGWGARQAATHGVYVQDDLSLHPRFWDVVAAIVRAYPTRVISLIGNHPLGPRAYAQGYPGYLCGETLGAGYVLPTALVGAFIEWRDAQPAAWLAETCEDFVLTTWLSVTGRRAFCPCPSPIDTVDSFASTNPKVFYTHRRSYLPWYSDLAAPSLSRLTSVDYWRGNRSLPDYGPSVTNDNRLPRGPFRNEEIDAASAASPRRGSAGSAASAAGLTLRHYPPESDNVRSGLDAVLGGSYDVPGLVFKKPPRVLDLGAHVGSFSVRTAAVYPGAKIVAYEPSPANASYLRRNVEHLGVEVHECAVLGASPPPRVVLHDGKQNTGQRSVHQLGEQLATGTEVATASAADLPPCDMLKIDTEGCELEILHAYPHLGGVRVVLLEWHRDEDYRELLRWMPTLGFTLVVDSAKGKWLSDRNLIFVREERHAFDGAGLGTTDAAPTQLFSVPRASLAMLTELAPSYDLHALPDLPDDAVVLNVGAHVGGFDWYALMRWPEARVISYEAHPETFALLKSNLAGLPVEVHHGAVVHPRTAPTARLFEGVHGRHECSVRDDVRWPHCSQRLDSFCDVPTIDASSLPPAHVLKVDTEGSEESILRGYRHLGAVRVLLCEAHPVGGDMEGVKARIRKLAQDAGLTEIPGHVMRFVRR